MEDLFKGFEAHHVIPANFLRNNSTVKELIQKSGIPFSYNNLDNLIFVPSENHTKGKERGHPKYDQKISDLINSNVKPLVDQKKYKQAMAELKKIVKKVKNKFIKEIIGSDKHAGNI